MSYVITCVLDSRVLLCPITITRGLNRDAGILFLAKLSAISQLSVNLADIRSQL